MCHYWRVNDNPINNMGSDTVNILKTILLVSACITLPASATSVVEEIRTVGNASRISIDSTVLNETRDVLVHLPKGYATSNKHYPVLYLLDGDRHFNHAITATEFLQTQERVPELIVVAITNTRAWGEGGGTRGRDLGYKRHDFTRYIENEVMPYVNTHYRTTGLNTLFGHSLAGYFATDLLATKPDLFKNYIAASPVLQGDEVSIYENLLATRKAKNAAEKSIYFTLSSGDEARNPAVTQAINNFAKLLKQKTPENLDWHYEFVANQTHSTIFYPTFFSGMSYVFKSYHAPHFARYDEYLDFGGMPALEAHYKNRAAIYGTDERIPELTLVNLARMLLNEGKTEDAHQLYRALTTDFPQSAASFSGLGQVYSLMAQYDKSIEAHKEAVRLGKKFNPLWQQRRFQSRLDTVLKNTRQQNSNQGE